MPHTPSLCGNFLTNKRSLVAFTWSLTTVLTLAAFCLAIVFTAHVHGHYRRMERYYEDLLEYNQAQREYYKEQQQQNGDDEDNNDYGHSSDDEAIEAQLLLGTVGSKSMAAVAAYTAVLAVGLVFYGSTTIVGFTSMRGVYIAPCFSLTDPYPSLKLGMFGGCIILFANLLLVCAIVLGEVRVEDWTDWRGDGDDNQNNNYDNNNNQNRGIMNEPYEIERIATILAVACMFLAPLYIIFAVLLFFYFGDERMLADDVVDYGTNPNYYEMDETAGKGPATMEFATMNNSNNNHHYHHPHLGAPTRESAPSFGAPGIDVGRVTTPVSMVGSQPGGGGTLSLPGTTIQPTAGAPSASLLPPAPAAANVTPRP